MMGFSAKVLEKNKSILTLLVVESYQASLTGSTEIA
jgi:hypothetical protein